MVHKIWFNDEKFRATRPKMIKSMAIYSSTKQQYYDPKARTKSTHQESGWRLGFSKVLTFKSFTFRASLRNWCAAQWPILTKLPIFAKIYHPIELIGFSPNLERDLLEDFQITWKLISFISPRAFDQEGMRKTFWKCIRKNDSNIILDFHSQEISKDLHCVLVTTFAWWMGWHQY